MAKVTVLGSGAWGMALAMTALDSGNDVTIWSPFEEEVNLLKTKRENEKLLKGIKLPEEIEITTDLGCAEDSDVTVIAVPSTAVSSVAEKLSCYKNTGIIVNVAKGFEKGTLRRLSEVIEEKLPDSEIVILSGPSHAEEVGRKIPTSLVAASKNAVSAEVVQDVFSNGYFRVYTSTDVIGVELGGAMKNVIAICAGICDGLGLGDNAKAALITRGLAEMTRLGLRMGADDRTLAGLAGIGDLVVTCTSQHSRNNRFGNKVGSGVPVQQALDEVGTVEGYYAALMAYELGKKYMVSLPIIEECYGVLYEGKNINDVVGNLMKRPTHSEIL